MAPKSVSGSKGKKPLIVSSPTKKRKSSLPEPSSNEGDLKTLLTQILGSVGELHQKTDLISTRLVLLEEKVKEQKKKEIIFIKQWEDKEEKENEGNDEVDEDEDKEEEEGAQEDDEEADNAKEISSEPESSIPASSKGHRYGLRFRPGKSFSNTADKPLVLTPYLSSSPSP